MRITLTTLAMAAWFTFPGFGQTDKTLYFTPPVTPADMTAVTTAIRTAVGLEDISIDKVHQALVMHGPEDKSVAAEWLFHHLEGSAAPAEYKMFGEQGEVLAVIPVAPTAPNADLTAVTTAIRTVADLQRLFPLERPMAMVARGTPDKIAAAEWLVQQVLPRDGASPTGDSPPYPMEPFRPDKSDGKTVVRIFRMDPKATNADLTAAVTAIRTLADIQRLFPFSSGKALIVRASVDQVAVAGWLVHELAKPVDASAVHQIAIPGLIDGVVRLFYVGRETSPEDLTALASQIRTTAAIIRLFPISHPPAVVLRGRPDQMATVETLVAKFAAGSH